MSCVRLFSERDRITPQETARELTILIFDGRHRESQNQGTIDAPHPFFPNVPITNDVNVGTGLGEMNRVQSQQVSQRPSGMSFKVGRVAEAKKEALIRRGVRVKIAFERMNGRSRVGVILGHANHEERVVRVFVDEGVYGVDEGLPLNSRENGVESRVRLSLKDIFGLGESGESEPIIVIVFFQVGESGEDKVVEPTRLLEDLPADDQTPDFRRVFGQELDFVQRLELVQSVGVF